LFGLWAMVWCVRAEVLLFGLMMIVLLIILF